MSAEFNHEIAVERAEGPFILTLDIGSSSVRAFVFDRLARPLKGSAVQRRTIQETGQDGRAVMDAAGLFDIVASCLDELFARLGSGIPQITAVAGCTLVSNLLGLDAAGRPVTPMFTYADTRPSPDAQALRQALDEAAVHQRTGCPLHSAYLPARFRWLARVHPEWLSSAKHWVTFGEYMMLRLSGETAVSYSAASWSGLLDRRSLAWDQELLEILPVDYKQLSPLVDVDQPWQGLRVSFAARWPALERAVWYPVVGDGAAANLGSGCTSPVRLAVTMGTSTALRVVLPGADFPVPEGLWCYRVDRNLSLLGGALTEGGNIFRWLQQTLQLNETPGLESALAGMGVDEHGLTFLPLLGGERSPGYAGQARGAIIGLSLATTPIQILRAGLEGVVGRAGQVYRLLRQALPADPIVIASGGALSHSPALRQMTADALGVPVILSAAVEASARGAAMLALRSLGAVINLDVFPRLEGPVSYPDPERHARFTRLIERQQHLYNQIIDSPGLVEQR